jgi:hypothetical protein
MGFIIENNLPTTFTRAGTFDIFATTCLRIPGIFSNPTSSGPLLNSFLNALGTQAVQAATSSDDIQETI